MESASTRLAGRIASLESAHTLTDTDAFSSVYAQTHLIVFQYIYGLHGGPQEDVEDLAAETFVRAWRARRRFVGGNEDALRWLLQIARNLVIDAHRRRGRRGIPEDIDQSNIPADIDGPEESTVLNEQRNLLARMLHTLNERQREILVLRYMLGWQVKRIADHLDMAPNTVSVNIRRALDRLRRSWPDAQIPVWQANEVIENATD